MNPVILPPPPPPRAPMQSAQDVQVQGRGWNLTLPAVVVTGILSTIGARLGAQSSPPDEELRRDVAELRSEVRYLRQDNREIRAELSQTEQAANDLRAELQKTNRLLEELRR